jgi:hypothetical protein
LENSGEGRKNKPLVQNKCKRTKPKTNLRSFWLRGRLETANFKVPNIQTASRSARLGVLSGWALSGA